MKINKLFVFLSVILGFLIIEIIFFGWINHNCFNVSFYKNQQKNIDLSEFQLNPTLNILDFIKNNDSNINYLVENKILTSKELTHLKDVQTIYQNFKTITIVFGITSIIILAISIIKKKYKELLVGIFISQVITVIFLFLMGCYIGNNFIEFWNNFHKLLFTNDLWKLTFEDTLIKLFPSNLFKKLSLNILINFGTTFIFLFTINLLILKIYINHSSK